MNQYGPNDYDSDYSDDDGDEWPNCGYDPNYYYYPNNNININHQVSYWPNNNGYVLKTDQNNTRPTNHGYGENIILNQYNYVPGYGYVLKTNYYENIHEPTNDGYEENTGHYIVSDQNMAILQKCDRILNLLKQRPNNNGCVLNTDYEQNNHQPNNYGYEEDSDYSENDPEPNYGLDQNNPQPNDYGYEEETDYHQRTHEPSN